MLPSHKGTLFQTIFRDFTLPYLTFFYDKEMNVFFAAPLSHQSWLHKGTNGSDALLCSNAWWRQNCQFRENCDSKNWDMGTAQFVITVEDSVLWGEWCPTLRRCI